MQSLRVRLRRRPLGEATLDDFELATAALPEPGPGQVLTRTLYLSLDPYMRGRMNAGKSYTKPVEVGAVMEGATVGEVVRANAPGLAPGDIILNRNGWQTYGVGDAAGMRKLSPTATTAHCRQGSCRCCAYHSMASLQATSREANLLFRICLNYAKYSPGIGPRPQR
jgi:NADPH-dependent curcumin reductase CurA